MRFERGLRVENFRNFVLGVGGNGIGIGTSSGRIACNTAHYMEGVVYVTKRARYLP